MSKYDGLLVQQMGALVASEDSIYIVSHVDVTMDIANNRIEQFGSEVSPG